MQNQTAISQTTKHNPLNKQQAGDFLVSREMRDFRSLVQKMTLTNAFLHSTYHASQAAYDSCPSYCLAAFGSSLMTLQST